MIDEFFEEHDREIKYVEQLEDLIVEARKRIDGKDEWADWARRVDDSLKWIERAMRRI